eukprot:m.126 g.126  ORF g.126 m.126 type:complete len:92 (+) comp680_c0_seq1:501-776(+)
MLASILLDAGVPEGQPSSFPRTIVDGNRDFRYIYATLPWGFAHDLTAKQCGVMCSSAQTGHFFFLLFALFVACLRESSNTHCIVRREKASR